jgi:hypothetical protein
MGMDFVFCGCCQILLDESSERGALSGEREKISCTLLSKT